MEKYINQFIVDVGAAETQKLVDKIQLEMKTGLAGSGVLAMLPSYTDICSGHESGLKLAIDFGGTNLRCVLYKLENHKIEELEKIENKMDQKIKAYSGKELFSFLADEVISFLERPSVKSLIGKDKESIDVGFTFSFGFVQTSIASGTLYLWSKGFSANDIIGQDVAGLLSSQLTEKGYGHVKIVALCNDTVGTLCAASLVHEDALIGFIQGTGTNACYREKTSNITKIKDPSKFEEYMIVNTECGALTVFPSTPEDDAVQRITRTHGNERFEKMSSGGYLPVLARVALRRCIENGWVLLDLCGDSPNWDPFEILSAKEIEVIQVDTSPDLVDARTLILKHSSVGGLASPPPPLKPAVSSQAPASSSSSSSFSSPPKDGGWNPDPDDLAKISIRDAELIRALFNALLNRSADYTAVVICAIVMHIITNVQDVPSVTVAIDGSIYLKHKGYKEELHRALALLLAAQGFLHRRSVPRVVCVPQQDGSGAGAAVIAAVQTKLLGHRGGGEATAGCTDEKK